VLARSLHRSPLRLAACLLAGLALGPAVSAESAVAAEASALVRGSVIEAFSSKPLAGARVSAAGVTAESGADGSFLLRLPPGRYTIEARAAGHLPDSRTVELAAGAELTLDLYLMERARFREEVQVTARASGDSDAPAVLDVRPLEVQQVAGGGENVFRTLQTLPGVAATEDFGSRLAVRGGSPDQNLTMMDGVEVHNPYRLFGLTSAFNPETIESFELFAGAFPAKYGDRLSSLLVVTNRDGDRDRGFGGSSSLSLTDANLLAEGRFPGRDGQGNSGSWLLTARRTYYDLFAESFTDSDLPSFGDIQARATFEPGNGRRLTLLGLLSREDTDAFFEGDRPGEGGDFVTASKNDLAGLQFDSTLGLRASSRTKLSYYENTESLDVDAQFRAEARRSNAPDESGFALANVVFRRDLEVRDLALRQELAWQPSSRHLLEAGFELHALRTRVVWDISGDRNLSEANGSSQRGGAGLPDSLDSSRSSTRAGAWLQDRWQVLRGVTAEPGLRLDWSGTNGRATLQPRLGVSAALGPRTQLRAGAGLHTQSPGYEKLVQSDYFLDLTDVGRLELEPERAWHFVLGVERELGAGVSAKLEGYYKRFDQLIVGRLETEAERLARVARYDFPAEIASSVPSEAQITTQPVNGASGRSWGFEALVTKRPTSRSDRLSGWASYSYGQADRDLYGLRLPFEYDRRHAFSLVSNLRLSGKLELATTLRVASGFPRTPVLGLRVNGVEEPVPADGSQPRIVPELDPNGLYVWTTDLGGVANLSSARLPAFARLDLRLSFRPRGANGRWLFYLDVINATNRDNASALEATLEHDPGADRPLLVETPTGALPFLPSFGIRFRF